MDKKLVAKQLIKLAHTLIAEDKEWTKAEWEQYKKDHPSTKIHPKMKQEGGEEHLTNTGSKPLHPDHLKKLPHKQLGEELLNWHGGGGTGAYAVGSTLMVGKKPEIEHVHRAISELMNTKKDAKFPDAVTKGDEIETQNIANELKRRFVK